MHSMKLVNGKSVISRDHCMHSMKLVNGKSLSVGITVCIP